MKLPSSWLKDWLRRTMLDDHQVVEALERAGMEVEQVNSSKQIDKRVVAALVKKVVHHSGADRLHLVDIETGEGNYRVVCGAPNVREGLKVAFAQIGTVLPSGDRIEKAKLRGEVSEGMLCSEFELELGNDHNGILELSSDVKAGTLLCDLYPADSTIDLKTPANRSDVLSVVGLAREIAAMTPSAKLAPLSPPALKAVAAGPRVEPGAQAARYMLAHAKVDQGASSPPQMAARLKAAGMRPISPVVDITNYVMLELGQPLHAFDAAKVKLPIAVRMAQAGETLTTLDGVVHKLTPEDLIIADQSGPIGLAGVMGGASTEVSSKTTEILLEAAVFDATTVRKMAKRHGLRTEASARFERGLPVDLAPLAVARTVELLEKIAGGVFDSLTDQLNVKPRTQNIRLEMTILTKLLGFGVTHKEAKSALEKLQISVGDSSNQEIVVPIVPWWRTDLKLPEDLVEEIVRVIGYDRVPSTIPSWRPKQLVFDREHAKRRLVQEVLYAAGLFEVMTYSFVAHDQLEGLGLAADDHLKLKNPLSTEQAYLRSSLLPSHLAVLARNRSYAKEIGFYEISKVFVRRGAGEQPEEPLRLGITIRHKESAYRIVKGIVDSLAEKLHVKVTVQRAEKDLLYADATFAPGRAGELLLNGQLLGKVGQLHPGLVQALKIDEEVAYVELGLTPLMESATPRQFMGLNKFPTTQRDLAVLVPQDVTWAAVSEAALPERPEFVSDYFGKGVPDGYKGLTLRLVLAQPDHTPTEAEAAELESKVFGRLERKVGARRRD